MIDATTSRRFGTYLQFTRKWVISRSPAVHFAIKIVTQQTLTTLEVRVEAVAVEEAKPVLPTSLIFVDGTHVDHRCYESFGRVDIDFGKFFAKLAEGTQLLGAVYCTAPYLFDHLRRHQKGVLNRLKQMRVKIYEGRHMNRKFKCRKCKHLHSEPVEKGTDVAVASHLVQAACLKQADRLILVAGDNDYWPALHIAKQVGAHCRFAYFVGPDESDQKVFNEVVMFAEQQQRIYQARPRLHE